MDSLQALLASSDGLLGKIAVLVVTLVVALAVQHVVVSALRRAFSAAGMPKASIFINIARAIIWAFALLAVLYPVFGVQPTAFVTALGISGVIISLGLQDTVSNVMGGLGIIMGKVIRPGDYITISGSTGRVSDITWRHTVVRTATGDEVIVPNSVINKSTLTRLTHANAHLGKLELVVAHGADLAAVVEDVTKTAAATLGDRLDVDAGSWVLFGSADSYGIKATVGLNLVEGEVPAKAVDEVMRALGGRSWLAAQ